MWSKLLVLFGIFDIVIIVIFLFGITGDSPLSEILAAPFCQGEVVMRSNYDSDQFFCREGDFERDITFPIVMIAIVGISGGVITILIGAFLSSFLSLSRQGRILKEGEPARAQILNLQSSGIRINNVPLYDVLLEVIPDYQPSYQATVRMRVNMFHAQYLQIGAEVPVMVDRNNPKHVAIDMDAIAQMGSPMTKHKNDSNSLPARLRELEESLRAGLITQEEYDRLRQRILDEV
jgi:hypothetical protein